MKPQLHNRCSIRLKGYDYSQKGLYFITLCTQYRRNLFGKIEHGEMILNEAGKMINEEWQALTGRYLDIILHEYIVMPNHFHSILEITNGNSVRAPLVGAPIGDTGAPIGDTGTPESVRAPLVGAPTLGNIIGAYKSITTVKYIENVKKNNWKRFTKKLWLRNYWEHIIRNEKEYQRISQYIINNPQKWQQDKFYK